MKKKPPSTGQKVKKKKGKEKPAAPRGRGRPTLFKTEYIEYVQKLARLGATENQIADFFGVSIETIALWKRKNSEFIQCLKEGRILADAEIGDSLYHRAKGYRHKAVKIMQYEGEVIKVDYTEQYPPDTQAIKFWLTNRQPKLWRDKIAVDVRETGGLADRLRKARERTRKK